MPVDKGDLAKGDVVGLVHPCGNSQHDKDSLLTEIWYLEYTATNIELPPLDNAGNVFGCVWLGTVSGVTQAGHIQGPDLTLLPQGRNVGSPVRPGAKAAVQ